MDLKNVRLVGALYTKSCACSKEGFIDKFVRDPNKTPNSSQRPPHNCPKCGNPVDGLHCRQCALLPKKLKEVWFTICDKHKIFLDFLNTYESSNNDSNVVNASQEPIVFNQDPGENSSQSPPQIDYHCCYGCGNSLDGKITVVTLVEEQMSPWHVDAAETDDIFKSVSLHKVHTQTLSAHTSPTITVARHLRTPPPNLTTAAPKQPLKAILHESPVTTEPHHRDQ
uniref:Uncharacterized protein n=1 Tax=Tanacetum cinerariifolium TaxID=118510 RepID=A0A6L2NRY4_TANCI|nr:hypothetical protein [Tanacetum cinerariifolium]